MAKDGLVCLKAGLCFFVVTVAFFPWTHEKCDRDKKCNLRQK